MSNIVSRLSAFRSRAIEHVVETADGPQTLQFYPPRVGFVVSGKMKQIVEPIALAISAAMPNRKGDASMQHEYGDTDEQGQAAVSSTFVQGVAPETIRLREERKDAAISRALEVLLKDDTRYQLGMMLADSLRDEFSSNEGERASEVRQFMDSVDLPVLGQMLVGYMKAVAPILNSQGKSMLSNLQGMVAQSVADKVGELNAKPEQPEQSESQSPAESQSP